MVGGSVDLEFLFQFHEIYVDLSGGNKRNRALEVQQWWEKEYRSGSRFGEEEELIKGARNPTVRLRFATARTVLAKSLQRPCPKQRSRGLSPDCPRRLTKTALQQNWGVME